nr:MAG: ORF2 [Giant panda anellovirus]
MGSAEELWLQSCTLSHKAWCSCPDYRRHIPGWPASTTADVGQEEGDISDTALVNFDLGYREEDATQEDITG